MTGIGKVLFVDPGTTYGQGGWQIARGACEGLRSLGVETELFPLSARTELMRASFALLSGSGRKIDYDDASIMDWTCGTLAERALLFKPDLVLAMKGTRISGGALAALRAAGIPAAAWTMDDPYELERYLLWAPGFDLIFSSEPRCLPVYEACGFSAELLAHAHDPAVHKPDPAAAASENYASDICFIGAAYPGRVRLLKAAAPFLAKHRTVLIGNWGAYRRDLPGIRVLDGFLPETEAVKFYSGAKIVLNMHRLPGECSEGSLDPEKIGAEGVNSRTFEIAGAGAFQLADGSRKLLPAFFKPGREIETFSGVEELQAKLARYLADDSLRAGIAAAGRRRALAEHTYAHRMKRLLAAACARRPEPARVGAAV